MLNVFITVDTEVWCDGWDNLDQKFPEYFKKYVYGPTQNGNFALPGKLSILEEYNIPAVFFVEALFSERFGIEPLQEIVGILQEKKQEIQLHMHTEWVDEVGDRLLPGITEKLRDLTYCSREQQSHLIKWGLQRMSEAGVDHINAFRAGSFGANRDTLRAVADNKLMFDTSYNLSGALGVADMAPGELLSQPRFIDNVYEYPVSVIKDPIRKNYRNVQINALSYTELVNCLDNAFEMGWDSLVVVTHNFELLSRDKTRVDKYAVNRFRRFCQYLDNNRDRFNVTGFQDLPPQSILPQPSVTSGELVPAGLRYIEQIARQFLYH
tara:strand:+ start:252 stop:1220 length:969 start_codon:yes stop_codon:yes gene_type:complete